jgi:Ca-activated chloride channel family protein
MLRRQLHRFLFLGGLCCVLTACTATAQIFTAPSAGGKFGGSMVSLDSIQTVGIDSNIFQINTQKAANSSPLETPSGSISPLDLKSPGKARSEYEKGYRLLMRKDLQAAIEHLSKSLAIYPDFVAAHNALGTAYLNLGQNQQAREEFTKSVALDGHLPNSYLNLGCAQLALQQYSEAEETLKKASSIAPLDLQLLTALTYGELLNRDYPAVIETARQVHHRKHDGASSVHFFAAAAWEAQDNLPQAQSEVETLLKEDPSSPASGQFQQILGQLEAEQTRREEAKKRSLAAPTVSGAPPASPTPDEISRQAQQALLDKREQDQIAEAEAEVDRPCYDCLSPAPVESAPASSSNGAADQPRLDSSRPIVRVAVDEVALFFSATDHGRPVTNLTASEIAVRDDGKPAEAILAFRNESELPLRLGLVIDTSNSVIDRFPFEQAAAAKFLKTIVTGKSDLAFVVGVNGSVLLVQDFTEDQALTAHAIGELAPGGGTALWDAIAFAADKLAKRSEVEPVARTLVVLSDGEDNSSTVTLKQAIASAQRGEVAVYTVSTRDGRHEESDKLIGDHALRTLSELTGGFAFIPGSVQSLDGSLADLRDVIRGRYLMSYKPSAFKLDGRYRAIDLKVEREGHKLKVYVRKGYYASAQQPTSSDQ